MDKAQKYTDKALMQIEKLKMLDASPLLSTFQLMLLEHIIMCRLIMGNKSSAINEVLQACHVCHQQPVLLQSHGAQLHCLLVSLGYIMSLWMDRNIPNYFMMSTPF